MLRLILLAMMLLVAPAAAEPAGSAQATATMSDFSSQGRPRIRVTPGRLLYRDCVFRLVQEWRSGGTYIVPRQRCWWVRG